MKTTKTNMWAEVAEVAKNRKMRIFLDLTSFKEIKKIEVDGKEYTIYQNSEYLHENGFMFSGVIFTTGINSDPDKLGIIVVDEYFSNLPEHVQTFLLYHEVAHLVNDRDMDSWDSIVKNIDRKYGDLPEMELLADKFAAEHLGYLIAVSSLEYIRDETDCPTENKIEFNKRIKYLDREEKLSEMTEEQRERNRKRVERYKKATAIVMSPGFIIGLSLAAVGVIGLGIRHKQLKPAMKKFEEKSKSIWNKYYK